MRSSTARPRRVAIEPAGRRASAVRPRPAAIHRPPGRAPAAPSSASATPSIGPQAHQQPLQRRLAGREPRRARRSRSRRSSTRGDVVGDPRRRQRRPARAAGVGDAAVRAGADAEIVAAAPVDQVVPRAGGRAAGMVGDLVGVEAGAPPARPGWSRTAPRPGPASGGAQRPRLHRPVERGAGLDGQLVGRDVLGAQRQRLAELGAPGVRRLAGPGVDQVDREAREGAARRPRRRGAPSAASWLRPRKASAASSSDCTPSDSRFTPAAAKAAKRPASASVGIGLQRHLEVGRRLEQPPRRRDDLAGPVRVHQRGRAAAEEDRDQPRGARAAGLGLQVGDDGAGQRRRRRRRAPRSRTTLKSQ